MRIMEAVSGHGINGAIVHCLELTRELARRGHEVTLVHRAGAWIAKQSFPNNVRLEVSEMDRWPLAELRRMAEVARQQQIDVFHSHQSRANFFGVLLRRFGGPPAVATAHNRKFQLHWRWNDYVIATTQATRSFQRWFNFCPARRLDLVRYFVNTEKLAGHSPDVREEVRREFAVPAGSPLLTVVGQVTRRKGLIYLVRALPELIRDFPNLRVLVVGGKTDDYVTHVKEYAGRVGLSDHLIWPGARNDVPRLLHSCDLMVLPSLEEQMPISVLEAMAIGLPVVTTRVGGIPECVRHQVEGWLVKPGSTPQLVEGVRRMLTDVALRDRVIAAARERIAAEFSPELQVRRVEQVFEKVVTRLCRRQTPLNESGPSRPAAG